MYSSLYVVTNEGSGMYINAKIKPDSIWKNIAINIKKPNTDVILKYGTAIILTYFISCTINCFENRVVFQNVLRFL